MIYLTHTDLDGLKSEYTTHNIKTINTKRYPSHHPPLRHSRSPSYNKHSTYLQPISTALSKYLQKVK